MIDLSPDDLPKHLTREEINQLAGFACDFPLSEKWIAIARLLTAVQKVEINKKIDSIKFDRSEKKRALHLQNFNKLDNKKHSSIEGQGMGDRTWNEIKKIQEANEFFGNMGRPDTPEEFKNRYGEWPPGFKAHDNKSD